MFHCNFSYEDHPGLEEEAAKEKKAKTEVKVDKKKNK